MKPVTLINHILVKPGMMAEFIEAQRGFAATGPTGLLGGRLYRSADDKSVILISQFQSESAQQGILGSDAFKAHLTRLRPMVESANPVTYEEAYTTGGFT
jgi:heme-degrading monooxygenase HmoA